MRRFPVFSVIVILGILFFSNESAVFSQSKTATAVATKSGLSHKLAFVSTDDLGVNSDIYTVNDDGSSLTQVTHGEKSDCGIAASQHGNMIAFTLSDDKYYFPINVINIDGSNQKTLKNVSLPAHGQDKAPSWSPDGKTILFSSNREDNTVSSNVSFEPYLMNTDGTHVTKLIQHPTTNIYDSVWSPDGKRIAFIADTGNDDNALSDIFTMNADGSGITRVTKIGNVKAWFGLSWSPDGKQIAFSALDDAAFKFHIYIVDLKTLRVEKLNDGSYDDAFIEWSPDGKSFAFSSDREGSDQVYVMNLDGSNQRKITSTGHNSCPIWLP